MASWRSYGLGVLVSAGIMITGTIQYIYPSGEAVAELAGASWERAVVARHSGTNAPAKWYDIGAVTTNAVTNVVTEATVTIAFADGVDSVTFTPSTFTFRGDWQTPRTMTITRKSPAIYGSGNYNVLYNGVVDRQLSVFAYQNWNIASGGDDAVVGDHVAFSPRLAWMGGQPYDGTMALAVAPTSTVNDIIVTVRTNFTGMAAISPYMRNDQIRYFLDELRRTVQEGWDYPGTYWLDPACDPDLLPDSAAISYTCPEYHATEVDAEGQWTWTRATTPVVAVPKLFTLNSVYVSTNAVKTGVWNQHYPPADADGMVSLFPFASVPGGSGFTDIDLTLFPWAEKGSWWLTAGLHTNIQWQLLGNETFTTSGVLKRASWVSTNDYLLGHIMATNCLRTAAVVGISSPCVVTETVYYQVADPSDHTETTTIATNYPNSFIIKEISRSYDRYVQDEDYSSLTITKYVLAPVDDFNYEWVPDGNVTVDENDVTETIEAIHSTAYAYTGLKLDYPSEYAVTNGYVARVRVYGVFVAARSISDRGDLYNKSLEQYFGSSEPSWSESYTYEWSWPGLPTSGTAAWTRSLSAENTGHKWVSDDDTDFFGFGVKVCGYNPNPALAFDINTGLGDKLDNTATGYQSAGLTKVRLTKLLDVSGAAVVYPIQFTLPEESAFTLSSTYDSTSTQTATHTDNDSDVVAVQDESHVRVVNGTSSRTQTYTTKRLYRHLQVMDRFIVVVDWNFKHLNPTTPFVPEPYTPAWLN